MIESPASGATAPGSGRTFLNARPMAVWISSGTSLWESGWVCG
jgi:hypothetical protein